MNLNLLLVAVALIASVSADEFLWGTATAAFQIEGYNATDGRQPSVWDAFSNPSLQHIKQNASGVPADEDYVRYNETIALLKEAGVNSYRFSISWSRIMANQTVENPAGDVNMLGVNHYIGFFDALQAAGIEPLVTMWHWDTPNSIETQYGGFLNSTVTPIMFYHYSKTLMTYYGKYTKYWATLNEPYTVFLNAYQNEGVHAPGHCSNRQHCPTGDDATEPYQVAYTEILSHAQAVKAFREAKTLGQTRDGAQIGIVLNADWGEPLTNSTEDIAAANRYVEWQVGMYFDPIFFGDWPQSMKDMIGSRLPTFTDEQKALINGTHDSYYLQNFYTSEFVYSKVTAGKQGWDYDGQWALTNNRNGTLIGPKSKANEWLYMTPFGIRKMQKFIHQRYSNMKLIVTENGWGDPNMTIAEGALNDTDRCNYYKEYIGNVSLAQSEDGVDVAGYFAWSLMDNFEWADGYTTRFGLTYVDYATQKRTPKYSFQYLKDNIFNKTLSSSYPVCTGLEPTPSSSSGFPWWGYALIGGGVLILVIIVVVYCCKKAGAKEDPKDIEELIPDISNSQADDRPDCYRNSYGENI